MRPRLLVIAGPTGTGKSSLAVALAERLDGEIVSCDALQVYRGFDVGTAKPSAEERARVPHHLVDSRDPREPWSMAAFVAEAERAIEGIAERGRVPLVVGGTGLYVRALLRGILPLPPAATELRARIDRAAERFGSPRLHRCVERLDPHSAARIRPADRQRVQRALELALGEGANWSTRLREEGTWEGGEERYPTLKIALELDRERLEARLLTRLRACLAAGWEQEVRRLLDSGVPVTATAWKAIGYREILRAVQGGADVAALEQPIFFATRRYAKRQLTWLRREPGRVGIDAESPDRVERILRMWAGD